MKKRTIALLLLVSVIVTIPAYALSPRTVDASVSLEFRGTTAYCTARIYGENLTDTISATMTLMQGSQIVAFWRSNGSGSVDLYGTADVERGATYTLTVDALINGAWQTPATITKTNN